MPAKHDPATWPEPIAPAALAALYHVIGNPELELHE
jgi:hypothetical protein